MFISEADGEYISVNFILSYCIYKNIHYIHSFVYVVELNNKKKKPKSIIQLTNMAKIVKLSLHWPSRVILCQREKGGGTAAQAAKGPVYSFGTPVHVSILHQAHNSYLIQLWKERRKERKRKRKEGRYGGGERGKKKGREGGEKGRRLATLDLWIIDSTQ